MRIWALIMVLLSCVVGFVLSYGYAYSQISELLLTSAGSVQTTALPAKR